MSLPMSRRRNEAFGGGDDGLDSQPGPSQRQRRSMGAAAAAGAGAGGREGNRDRRAQAIPANAIQCEQSEVAQLNGKVRQGGGDIRTSFMHARGPD